MIKNKCEIYVISKDKDLSENKSSKLITQPNLRTILNKINTQYKNDRLDWVTNIFNVSENLIKQKIEDKFVENMDDFMWYDISLSYIEVQKIKLFEASIVQDNPKIGATIFQFDADIYFNVTVDYNDYSMSVYDKEDSKWLMPEERSVKLHLGTTQTIEIEIEAFYEDREELDSDDFGIHCIYCGIPDSDEITDELQGYLISV